MTPGDDGAIALERRERVARREDLRYAGAELAGHPTAIAAINAATPGDDRSIALDCREGALSRENLRDAVSELEGHPTAVAAHIGVAPGDDGAIASDRRERTCVPIFPLTPPRPAWPIGCHHHPLRRDRGGGRLLAGGDHVAGWCRWRGHDLGNDRFTRINHAVG